MPTDTSAWEPENGWEINMGPDHVYREGQLCVFKLVPIAGGYEVTFNDDEMDEVWRGVKLTWRGNTCPAWGDRKLDRWTGTQEYAYDKMIQGYLTKVDTDTQRLEGEIEVAGKRESVTMFLAKSAVREEALKPLLIIILRTRFPWSQPRIALHQDGTAHAKPH
jgi:hypothetical protein